MTKDNLTATEKTSSSSEETVTDKPTAAAGDHFVYILECADGTLYTGWTTDVEARVATHNSGKGAKYTRSRLPVRLAYYEELPDKSAALRRERAIKRLTRSEKEKLIEKGQ